MKSFIGLVLVASVALTGVLSLPAGNPSDDVEVIGYPRRVLTKKEGDDDNEGGFKDFKGVIDTGSGYPFLQPNPSVINFGFFDSFDDLFRRFRARLWPVAVVGSGDDDESDEDSGCGGCGISTNFDTSKGNTTSTVKVVDGHKVEVNETVYGDEHSIFKVRVVNVRPLEDGETVEETVKTNVGGGGNDNSDDVKPVTSSPATKKNSEEDDDEDAEGKREPLAKQPNENEIEGNIDDPEHLSNTENIVEATTTIIINDDDGDKMLPTTTDEDLAFVTDNSLNAVEAVEEMNANGSGNNEFETNMSALGKRGGANSAHVAINDDDVTNDDNFDVTDANVEIENNEDTEDTEEVNDNLNESSNTAETADIEGDDAQEDEEFPVHNNGDSEFEDVESLGEEEEDAEATREVVNANVRHSNYAAIRNKQREDVSSSDDEDEGAVEMHPTFNDEWGTHNNNLHNADDNKENNDLSNDIDVYDVEPIDLSNDIAVNDAANLPLNPDAEFIDVFGSKQTLQTMPKFEKLSLSEAVPENSEHLSSSSLSGGGGGARDVMK